MPYIVFRFEEIFHENETFSKRKKTFRYIERCYFHVIKTEYNELKEWLENVIDDCSIVDPTDDYLRIYNEIMSFYKNNKIMLGTNIKFNKWRKITAKIEKLFKVLNENTVPTRTWGFIFNRHEIYRSI